MIAGHVSAKREPQVELWVYDMVGTPHPFTVAIDTRFTAQLTLPAADIAALKLHKKGVGTATLADGSKSTFDVFYGLIDWHGGPLAVAVESVECEPLVGMKLLADSELFVACQPGAAVEITRTLPPPAPAP